MRWKADRARILPDRIVRQTGNGYWRRWEAKVTVALVGVLTRDISPGIEGREGDGRLVLCYDCNVLSDDEIALMASHHVKVGTGDNLRPLHA